MKLVELFDRPGGYAAFLKELGATRHPVMRLPDEATARGIIVRDGEGALIGLLKDRQVAIDMERDDPLGYGWEPGQWRDADALLEGKLDILVMGGNRSGKSAMAAKRVCQLFRDRPGAQIWCLSTSNETSIRDQQKLVWNYMPREWKGYGKSRGARILYAQATGFSDKVVVGPNRAEIRFMNYKQDRDVIEGGQIDLFWADELIPMEWLETIRGRTVDRRGRGYVTFTPVNGYTQTVADYMNGAVPVSWVPCDLFPDQKLWPGVPAGHVPYEMECVNGSHGVIFFQPRNNPYISYRELKRVWRGKPMADVLCRVHGLTKKTSGNVFPRFGPHNVVEEVPEDGTNYQFIDFAWQRNWAMIWLRVTRVGGRRRVYIYRDWPDYQTYGEWVVPSDKADGARGPAQESLGYGIGDYKALMRALERERIFLRYGDPRSGKSAAIQEDGQKTIMDLLLDGGTGDSVDVCPVSTTQDRWHTLHGVGLVNQWLEYDHERAIGPGNEPELYVHKECRQVIDCMRMWTGSDGDRGASKDFVDLVRYAAMMDIEHVERVHSYRPRTGGY